jgi:hypothetical protein
MPIIIPSTVTYGPNLLSNGSFESPGVETTYAPNFPGWVYVGDTANVTISCMGGGYNDSCNLQMGNANPASITQSIATTPGTPYLVSFYLWPDTYFEQFKASFGTQVLLDISEADATDPQLYMFTCTAVMSNTTVKFEFQDTNNFFQMDAASVQQIITTNYTYSQAILGATYPGSAGGGAGIRIDAVVESPEGIVLSRSVNGYTKSRIFEKTRNPQVFTIKHTLTNEQKLIIEQHYVLNRLSSFSFTIPSFFDINNQATYTVQYVSIPKFTMLGGTFWEAEVKLIRV